MTGLRAVLFAASVLTLLGATAGSADQDEALPPMPGSDVSAQGCKASAGYAWCARTARCERPWELARKESLAPGMDAFRAYCEPR